MKTLFAILLLITATSAYAGMWNLIRSDYQAGTGWICTYQLMGTQYQTTIISQNVCKSFISN